MTVLEADAEPEVRACFPVVRQLRPNLDEAEFLDRVERQREDGYRLVYVEADGEPVAVAGFRVLEILSRGRFLYVDDLVTREGRRGEGFGTRLLEWLEDHARERGCRCVDLDSGFGRKRAHRFYLDQGMEIASLHFRKDLE